MKLRSGKKEKGNQGKIEKQSQKGRSKGKRNQSTRKKNENQENVKENDVVSVSPNISGACPSKGTLETAPTEKPLAGRAFRCRKPPMSLILQDDHEEDCSDDENNNNEDEVKPTSRTKPLAQPVFRCMRLPFIVQDERDSNDERGCSEAENNVGNDDDIFAISNSNHNHIPSKISIPMEVLDNGWNSKTIDIAKRYLLENISGRSISSKLIGLNSQRKRVYDLLLRTVEFGESNSCLILGPRGSGKTALLEHCLEDIKKLYHGQYFTVRLNGLVQTDDKVALRDIARQLSLEHEMVNYSFTSFANTFSHLLSMLGVNDDYTMPILFILDEFDLFAQHSRQALLYNLFDVAQSKKSPIAVIGLTCRLDALEMLEKRVKSRFSHRNIYIYPSDSFGSFCEIIESNMKLTIKQDDNNNDELKIYRDIFNNSLHHLFMNDDTTRNILRIYFDLGKDIRAVHRLFMPIICALSSLEPFIDGMKIDQVYNSLSISSKLQLCKGLSILETCIIIAADKLYKKDYDMFNFLMIYDEYKSFMDITLARSGALVQIRLFKKSVALKAFEHLISFELFRAVEINSKLPKEYRMFKLLLDPVQVRKAVENISDLPTLIRRWGL